MQTSSSAVQELEWRMARMAYPDRIGQRPTMYGDPELFLVPRSRMAFEELMNPARNQGAPRLRFLDDPESLLSFTRLKPEEDLILEFAQRFGSLGVEQRIVFPGAEDDFQPHWGESLRAWRYEWYDLHFAELVWRACCDLEAPDVDTLSQYFHWIEIPAGPRRGRSYCAFTTQYVSTLSDDVNPGEKLNILTNYEDYPEGMPYPLVRGDLLTAARLYLALEVQSHLENRATLRLLTHPVQFREDFLGDTKHCVVVSTRWDSKRLKPVTVLRPSSLLGVMWLEFQRNLVGNVAFRQCGFCGTWFKPKGERGQRAKWCSGSCKTRAFYRDNGGRTPKTTRV